jgi:hypothetical protein
LPLIFSVYGFETVEDTPSMSNPDWPNNDQMQSVLMFRLISSIGLSHSSKELRREASIVDLNLNKPLLNFRTSLNQLFRSIRDKLLLNSSQTKSEFEQSTPDFDQSTLNLNRLFMIHIFQNDNCLIDQSRNILIED